MESFRFAALALTLTAASFFGVRWLIAPGADASPTPVQKAVKPQENPKDKAAPAARTKEEIEEDRRQLRSALFRAANDLIKKPCDTGNSYRYIEAATNYTRAWVTIAPCLRDDTCNKGDGEKQLDRLQKAFGTALDKEIASAMTSAHKSATLDASNFPPELVHIIGRLASDQTMIVKSENALGRPQGERLQSQFSASPHCNERRRG